MPEDSARVSEQQHRHQPSAPESVQGLGEQLLPLAGPSYSLSLLGDPRLSGRGNGPVRAAVVQRMQRTAGNRATVRLIQRMLAAHPLVTVQRDDDDEEEQNAPQEQDASQQQDIPPAPNRPLPPLPNQPNGRARANAQAIPQAPNRPLPPLPDAEVADLELNVDVETANRSKLGFMDIMNSNVGHAWVKLRWDDSAGAVPDTLTDPTKAQLQAKKSTSMGFWPLVFRASDWTDEAKEKRENKLKDWPQASEQSGASQNRAHTGFNPFGKNVPGRVEQPDMSSHKPKALYKYRLTLPQVASLAEYADSKRDAKYSLFNFNCTTFAVGATQAAGQAAPSGEGINGITYPNALYAQLYELLKTQDKTGYDAKKGYLASLGADEQHN